MERTEKIKNLRKDVDTYLGQRKYIGYSDDGYIPEF